MGLPVTGRSRLGKMFFSFSMYARLLFGSASDQRLTFQYGNALAETTRTKRRKRMSIFAVPDMSCGHCRSAIEKAINAVDAKATIQFDMEARRIEVTSAVANADLSALLEKEGYPNTLVA
jgi:copper chaperone